MEGSRTAQPAHLQFLHGPAGLQGLTSIIPCSEDSVELTSYRSCLLSFSSFSKGEIYHATGSCTFSFFLFPFRIHVWVFSHWISEIPGLSIYYKIYQAKMSDDKLLSVTQTYNSIFSVWDFSQQRLFFHFPPFFPWPFNMSYERVNTAENM